MPGEKPRIVCFACNFAFCESGSRIPSNASVARVNCVGRMDPALVLETFEKGADAVMLAGCKYPDCHFVEGNVQAERAVKLLKKLITLTGLEADRVKLVWYSPLEKESLASFIKEYSKTIGSLGPLSLENAGSKLMTNIAAAKNAAADFRLRVLLGREKELTEEVNVYSEKLSQEEFDQLIDEAAEDEFIRQKIHVLTQAEPLSVKSLADATELKPAAVLKQIVNMRRRNMIAVDRVDGTTPLYRALEVK